MIIINYAELKLLTIYKRNIDVARKLLICIYNPETKLYILRISKEEIFSNFHEIIFQREFKDINLLESYIKEFNHNFEFAFNEFYQNNFNEDSRKIIINLNIEFNELNEKYNNEYIEILNMLNNDYHELKHI